MEDLLIPQESLAPVIKDNAAAITNTPNETWTQGLISSRLELLDRY